MLREMLKNFPERPRSAFEQVSIGTAASACAGGEEDTREGVATPSPVARFTLFRRTGCTYSPSDDWEELSSEEGARVATRAPLDSNSSPELLSSSEGSFSQSESSSELGSLDSLPRSFSD